MADPSSAPSDLPKDPQKLALLRAQLGDYLATLERNTDAIQEWLKNNEDRVILGYHAMERAFQRGTADDAKAAIAELGDAIGFILVMKDFRTEAEAHLGFSSVEQILSKAIPGLPVSLFEKLPQVILPQADENAAPAAAAEPLPEPKKSGLWSGLFKGKAAKVEEQARAREEETRRQWRLARERLTALQSDRHYYVDSFMDWVGETLGPLIAPDGDGAPAPDDLMDRYQDPQYVLAHAKDDYYGMIRSHGDALEDKARDYSAVAQLLDNGAIGAFIKKMPGLFDPAKPEGAKIRLRLMKDLTGDESTSLADYALRHVGKRQDQLALLTAAVRLEKTLRLKKSPSKADTFICILNETLTQDPLSPKALALAMQTLSASAEYNGNAQKLLHDANKLLAARGDKPVFQKIAARFGAGSASDFTVFAEMLGAVLGDIAPAGRGGIEKQVARFAEAASTKNALQMHEALQKIHYGTAKNMHAGTAFMALWNLCYPARDLLAVIDSAAADTANFPALVSRALNAGILDGLKENSNSAVHCPGNAVTFFKSAVMPQLATFDIDTARKLIGFSFANGGLDGWRAALCDGMIEKTATADIPEPRKIEWLAAMLEPFASDIARANILHDAAGKATPDARAFLDAVEAEIFSKNIRLNDGKILASLGRIANVWHLEEESRVYYTVNGLKRPLAENISAAEAQDLLTLIARKQNFKEEYKGLFNPANADRIETTRAGSSLYGSRKGSELYAPAETMKEVHTSDDFLHEADEKNGKLSSFNAKSIALLQKLDNGNSLLVDASGNVFELQGRVVFAAPESMIDIDGGATLVNPANAGILALDEDGKTLRLRIESRGFENFLRTYARGDYMYAMNATEDGVARLRAAIALSPGIAPAQNDDGGCFYFNMDRLGYLKLDAAASGFTTLHFSPAHKPGKIHANGTLAQGIFSTLSQNPALLTLGDAVFGAALLDDAYYIAAKGKMTLRFDTDIVVIDCKEEEADAALKKIAALPGFLATGFDGGKISSVSQTGKITLFTHARLEKKIIADTDSDSFFFFAQDADAGAFLDAIEQGGFDAPSADRLKNALKTLSPLSIPVTPSLTELGAEYLLDQITGKRGETKPMPAARQDFSIFAAKKTAGDVLPYPARPAPGKAPKP